MLPHLISMWQVMFLSARLFQRYAVNTLTLPPSDAHIVVQLCKQLAMFEAEDINLYRCPQNPSVRRC